MFFCVLTFRTVCWFSKTSMKTERDGGGGRRPQRSESRWFLNNLCLCQNDRWRHLSFASISPDGSAATGDVCQWVGFTRSNARRFRRRKDGAKTPSRMIKHCAQCQRFAFSQQWIILHLTLRVQMNLFCAHVCLFCQQSKTKCIHTEILIVAYVFTKGALCMWFTTCLNTIFLHQPFIKNNRLEKSLFEHFSIQYTHNNRD